MQLPKHLMVVGGSFVALELAQAFRRLGSRVTVMARFTLMSREDSALGEGLHAAFEAEGIRALLHTVPSRIEHDGATFRVSTGSGVIEGDRLLVATSRRPSTAALGLVRAGVAVNGRGAIMVNERLETSTPGIYAAGGRANTGS